LEYKSGLCVYGERTMHFDEPEKCGVLITFHSQWFEKPLQLYFGGVRKMFVQGRMDNYMNDIYDASIKFYEGLLPHKYYMSGHVIVWADREDFNAETDVTSAKDEPCDTYVIANTLKWRLVD
ncbi:MAG: hypothetical protein K2K04_00920, partial [Clostridia bacterium]|nr:hypothetical protein [Clostridia bacterium]